ncbi:uncharacterized protein NECHADRAFT_54441 [Fusarium vanettenii 77-13-4]|uniref:MHYT domain-containing protein n=1 Tax=Fusarium vanettenii (strain ATCC MYA-4622 / CBS 123669 / FGSC 9596 / NRRL 45880 / 77-13-4) TaxID=660122 RepID=C7ZN85_FUSV7|nr:uncharacterized protein NECHADRAFT_54441 [Fusarium vanettenii 77-13-4]EEU34513.1 hypothetical protein NECHADRAFT_54441 [Fusarium vanettenii 77-13-4]
MPSEDLFDQYLGHVVPQSYNGGFIALSYLVSLVGAASTLELINRRTGSRGFFNHLLLVSSAITMGGISIWCMHFIGNRAIDLANHERDLQVAYSSGFTAVSFFVPIVVLLAAFVAIGTNNYISWWRITIGSVLCGAAICGMHYLGNSSIKNYTCIYRPAFIVGAAIIAVFASIIALSLFFVFRGLWAHSWWKRSLSAFILAGAVSGMHWCAVVGTRYRLVNIQTKNNEPSRNATVIVVICLSLGACLILAGSAILRARKMKRSALRAQQITLGTAIFDKHGRILVDPDGLMPSVAITDSFLEKNSREGFSNTHPVFHWLFQASRNWSGISTLLDGMKHHLLQLPHSGGEKSGIQLINEHGEMIKDYDAIFRELFCVAALTLSEQLGEHITSMGVLWDDVLSTGAYRARVMPRLRRPRSPISDSESTAKEEDQAGVDAAEKGFPGYQTECGRGSLMLLVRRVRTSRDADRLTSAGFRFAELHQVSNLIQASMQIQSNDFEKTLRGLETYAGQDKRQSSGSYIGLFAVRARVDSRGFQVLVHKGARHVLPSERLHTGSIDKWQVDFLRQFQGMPVSSLVPRLFDDDVAPASSNEKAFARQMGETIKSLRKSIKDPLFEQAVLSPTVVHLPGHESQAEAVMITLRLVVPIHSVLSSADCEFVPLSILKMHQASDGWHQEFTRDVHREFGSLVQSCRANTGEQGRRSREFSFWPFASLKTSSNIHVKRNPMMVLTKNPSSPASARSSSTVNLCPPNSAGRPRSVDTMDEINKPKSQDDWRTAPPSYGGILVFKEVTVNVDKSEGGRGDGKGQDTMVIETSDGLQTASMSSIELQPMTNIGTDAHIGSQDTGKVDGNMSNTETFVDILFAEAVGSGL